MPKKIVFAISKLAKGAAFQYWYLNIGKEKQKEYYQAHREERKEYNRKYRKAHKEEYNNYMRNYFQAHREQWREYDKKYKRNFRLNQKIMRGMKLLEQ